MRKKGTKKKRRKIKLKAFFLMFIILIIVLIIINLILNLSITNIYIKGNSILKDEEIIEIAKLKNYPKIFSNEVLHIEENLEANQYVRKVKIKRTNFFSNIYITIYENYPLFTYQDQTYLYDLSTTNDKFAVPLVTNEIPDDKYEEFISCIRKVDLDILERISEIKYDPNDVDKERFYLTMSDGIYVYITLNKFTKINDYDTIVATLEDKKGILYLDNGGYFEVKNE